ncbi:MAG: haloacid dehalogenase-like hydrolase [Curvibacter lanceolatus]|jgi:phosphoserine phosphatase|uniref:haloacid dehalogenase-like hydrolase n=1 Tax=Curvibacter lanceolatus TaxID=86182 RepID=UPI00036D9F0F|nr:haloacid dehalogenase-like hydrolase [Curvibacter lanceolatus]MBV5290824.1 haloacid dehalogenase-like hydrolase [Curvibacter lanceolatus]
MKTPALLRLAPLTLALSLLATLASTGCSSPPTAVQAAAPQTLAPGQWESFNRQQINELIARVGKTSAGYNPAKPPYVVFDWDNTSVFLDIEEAALIYQLENLRFGASPEQLEVALRRNIPATAFKPANNNAAGQPVSIDTIVPDILDSYRWLYTHYSGLKGQQPLAEVQRSPHYQAFVTKVRYLYEAIGDTFDHDTAYPWVTYLFAGMTEAQVRQLTVDTVKWQQTQPVEKVKWSTPAELPGRAGLVSVSWKNGLRLVPEMQDLYGRFKAAGFDVWVCSASFVDVIKEISSNPAFGYQVKEGHVLAMELERDAQGRILPDYRHGYDQTQGPGKTRSIQRFLVSRYGYGPVFIAGDSEGDQNMMADFSETQKVLIVNRLRDPKSAIGQFSALAVQNYGKPDSRYLLQGRDDNTGRFVPSQLHTPLGATAAKALK